MGIRTKIFSGFLTLSLMLAVAGMWSIHELDNIGMSVQRFLDENYKSITAAKVMTESLEREDSGILLLLLGKRKEAMEIIEGADRAFTKAYETARNNITIAGEEAYVEAIAKTYRDYKELWTEALSGNRGGDLSWYFGKAHAAFTHGKEAVLQLTFINDQAMYKTASGLESRAYRAMMPGIIAIASAFIFALLFSYLLNLFFVSPIIDLTRGIENYLDSGKPLAVAVKTKDEIADLAKSVKMLIARSGK